MADDDEELRKPRKKKGFQRILKESPFPIPIESLTGKPASEKRWYYYFGKLQGDKVVVDRLGDMTFLYKMVKLFRPIEFLLNVVFVSLTKAGLFSSRVVRMAEWLDHLTLV